MQNLGKIIPTIKSGEESLEFDGNKLPNCLLDFWKWSVSDILSNSTRGRFAEFIVATASHVDLNLPRDEWQSFDLITPENIKIEVKSSAYIQSWHQQEESKISFSIKPARSWDSETGIQSAIQKRHADVYVMCLLKHKQQDSINPLDMSQWEFYVLSKFEIDNYKKSQHSITLNSLNKLTIPVTYEKLSDEIKAKNNKNVYNKQC